MFVENFYNKIVFVDTHYIEAKTRQIDTIFCLI